MKTKRKNIGLGIILALLFVLIVGSNSGLQAAETNRSLFNDISNTDPELSYIQYLSGKEIIEGYPDGSFKPQEGLTRAQAAVVIVKAAQLTLDQSAISPFKDLPAGHWGRTYIAAAVKSGYISGYPDGTFKPEQKLSRAEGISLILTLSEQPLNAELPILNDINDQHWAAPAVAVGLASGMVGLSADGKNYLPDAAFTRINMVHALGILLTRDPGLSASSLPGKIKSIQGTVKIIKADSQTEAEIKAETTVTVGDCIITGSGSSAELNYPDGSSLLIKENSQVSIKAAQGRKYIKSNGQEGIAVDWLNLDMKKGTMFTALATKHEGSASSATPNSNTTASLKHKTQTIASLNSMEYIAAAAQASNQSMPWYETSTTKKVKVKVDMPWGVAAVRGTFVVISIDPNGQASVSCLNGDADVSNGGQTVSLSQNQSTQVNGATTPPPPPAPMPPAAVELFNQVVEWIQQTAVVMDQNQEQAPPAPPVAMIQALQEILAPAQPTTAPAAPGSSNAMTALQAINQALGNIGINYGDKGMAFQLNNPTPTPGSSHSNGSSSSVPVSAITVAGDAVVGKTLTANPTPANATVTYIWKADATQVGTSAAYLVTANDIGKTITVTVTGTGSYSGTVTSAATSVVPDTVAPTVVNLTAIGDYGKFKSTAGTLTVVLNSVTSSITVEMSEAVSLVDSPVVMMNLQGADHVYGTIAPGSDNKSLIITPNGSNGTAGLVGTFTFTLAASQIKDAAGNNNAETTFNLTVVAPRVGTLLSAGVLTPNDATATYQWQRVSESDGAETYADITDAVASTYTPVIDDLGFSIRVVTTLTGEYTGTFSSAPIAIMDAYEPDDNSSAASPVVIGAPSTPHSLTSGDQDWIKFTGTAGKSYLIRTSGTEVTGTDTLIDLYATDAETLLPNTETPLAENDDYATNADGDLSSGIAFTCINNGTYYVKTIYYNDDNGTGRYDIAVIEPAQAAGTASAIKNTSIITYTLTIGTFDTEGAKIPDNWVLAGKDCSALEGISAITLSGNTATITVNGTIGAPDKVYTLAPALAALADGFTAPAFAPVTIQPSSAFGVTITTTDDTPGVNYLTITHSAVLAGNIMFTVNDGVIGDGAGISKVIAVTADDGTATVANAVYSAFSIDLPGYTVTNPSDGIVRFTIAEDRNFSVSMLELVNSALAPDFYGDPDHEYQGGYAGNNDMAYIIKTNQPCMACYIVVANGAEQPSVGKILSGLDSSGASALRSGIIPVATLYSGDPSYYYAYIGIDGDVDPTLGVCASYDVYLVTIDQNGLVSSAVKFDWSTNGN